MERVTGQRILSDQKIGEIIVNKAVEVSSQWVEKIEEMNSLITEEIEIAPTVDIYNPLAEEILLFDDGIGVKKQKAHRLRRGNLGAKREQADNQERNQSPSSERATTKETEISKPQKSRKNVITDVVLLETPTGKFEDLTSPIDESGKPLLSLERMIISQIKTHYCNKNHPWPMVAITNGASNIRVWFK